MNNSSKQKPNSGSQDNGGKIPFISALRPVEMIGIALLVLAAMMFGLSKCSGDKKSGPKTTVSNSDSSGNSGQVHVMSENDEKVNALRRRLYVTMDSLKMRKEPNKDSELVKLLNYGDELIDMGEYQNEQSIRISADYVATEPWIKIRTKDGITGWVFGAGVRTYPKKRPIQKEKPTVKEEEKPAKESAKTGTSDSKTTGKTTTGKTTDSKTTSGKTTDSKTKTR
jgi:hypothetical protein